MSRAGALRLILIVIASAFDYSDSDTHCRGNPHSYTYLRSGRKIVALDARYFIVGNWSGCARLSVGESAVFAS